MPGESDVFVFGATPAGVVAAIAAGRSGATVLLMDAAPLPGGLGVEAGSRLAPTHESAVGGLARDLYVRVARRLGRPGPACGPVWVVAPACVDDALAEMLAESSVTVAPQADIRSVSCDASGRLRSIETTDGRTIAAHVFVDASATGDLLAAAGTNWTIGREGAETYGESLAGIQTRHAATPLPRTDLDPYADADQSTLLSGLEPAPPGREGQADSRMPAGCFRLTLTDQPGDFVPIERPDGYDAETYELLVRHLSLGRARMPWRADRLPGQWIDVDARGAISMEAVALADGFLDADPAARAAILDAHRRWQQGWLWTLAHDLRVPGHVRDRVRRLGLCRSLSTETDHWPTRLDLRWGRRLLRTSPVTQRHVTERVDVPDPIALGPGRILARTCRRFVDERGRVTNEGALQIEDLEPWPIPAGVLMPDRDACGNLLSPTCPAASYVAACSLADQVTQVCLAVAAGTLAALAVDGQCDVQAVDYPELRDALLAQGQVLRWQPSQEVDRRWLDRSLH